MQSGIVNKVPQIPFPAAVCLRDPVDGAEDDDEDGGDEGEAHKVHAVHYQQRVSPAQRLSWHKWQCKWS